LEALAEQTLAPSRFEVVSVNDGSTDGGFTREAIGKGLKAVRGVYIEHEKNLGLAAARNTAMKAARGKYLLFINDDTIAASDLLEQHLRIHQSRRGENIAVLGSFDFPSELLERSALMRVFSQTTLVFAYPEMIPGRTYGYMNFWTANVSVPKEVSERVGDFDLAYRHYGVEDTEWGYRAEKIGCPVVYHPEAKATHEHDMSSLEGFCERQRKVASNFVLFFRTHPEVLLCPPWSRLAGLNRSAIRRRLESNKTDIERLRGKAGEICALDLRKVPPRSAGQCVEGLREAMEYINQYYWDVGYLEGLDKQGVDAFYQLGAPESAASPQRMKTAFKISVIIPTCNRANILGKCLDSLAAQTMPAKSFEVLLCDDGSTDNTPELVGSYKGPFRLQHFRHEKSMGPAAARNKCIRAASGELLLIINDDTICAPDLLETHLRAHTENKGKKISVLGIFEYTPEAKTDPFVYFLSKSDILFAYPGMKDGAFYPYRYFWTCNISIARQAVLDAGLFDEDFKEPMAEDTELGYRLEKMGYVVLYCARAKSLHDHSLDVKGFAKRYEMSGRNMVKLFSKHPELLLRERKLFGFSDLSPETLQKFSEFVDKNRSSVEQLTTEMQKIHDLKIDDQGRLELENGLSVPSGQLMDVIGQVIGPVHQYNLYKGILKVFQDRHSSSATMPKSHRLSVTSTVDRRLRILFTMVGWKESGGGTIHPRALALRLARMGHDVGVFYAAQKHPAVSAPYHLDRAMDGGVNLYGLWNRATVFLDTEEPDREIRDENVLKYFSAVLDEFRPDVVHFHSFLGLSFAIGEEARRRNIPTFYTPHNYHMIDPAMYMLTRGLQPWKNTNLFENSDLPARFPEKKQGYERRVRQARRLLNEVVDCTLAISTRVRELLIDFGARADKIAVVHQAPHTVENLIANPPPVKKPRRPVRFGFIGNVMPYKGVHKLLEASQIMSHPAEFHIFGAVDKHYADALKKLDRRGVARWRGCYSAEHLAVIASEVDAIVVPSIWEEGAGLVNIESLAMKLPIIGARIGGIPDFVSEGRNGRLYPAHSEKNLASVLDEIASRPEQITEWSKNCRLPYSFCEYAEHLASVYSRFSEGKRLPIEEVSLVFGAELNAGRKASAQVEIARLNDDSPDKTVLPNGIPAANHAPGSRLSIVWEGSQFVYHSLALINRELCLKLIDAGHDVTLLPYEKDQFGPEVDPRFTKIASRLLAAAGNSVSVHIRHQWPPNFTPPPAGHWVIVQPWEYGRIPEEWVEPMSTLVDEIWVPSRHVQKSYISSGVPSDRIQVIPNGVNPELFHPEAAPYPVRATNKFKFLFVGGSIWRKGVDLLLQAYCETFRHEDEVALVLKDIGQDSFYRGQGVGDSIRRIQNEPTAPELVYLTQKMEERHMPGLYTACDCLVHPYRGEGFGLPVLEAMACGVPVITTEGGSTDDFCPPDGVFLIPSERREFTPRDTRLAGGAGWILEPDLNALKSLMRQAFEKRVEAKQRALRVSERVRRDYSWQVVAGKVVERIRRLSSLPVRRESRL
ncbi:MAG: glycosyltransferase, partial [Syntrophobacteraceae bacterium]|nr:glycosyltransferase [Syntrophobacteraceae bacterium]